MTDWIRELYEWLVLAMLVGLLLLTGQVLLLSHSIKKYFVNRKYKLETTFEYDPLASQNGYTIRIFNNNVSDTRIVALGYVYKDRTIDYYKTYLSQIGYAADARVTIPSREAIKVAVESESLLRVIEDANAGSHRMAPLHCFVTDVLGMTTTLKATRLKKIVKRQIKEKHLASKVERKERMKALKRERSALRKHRRKARMVRFKTPLHRLSLKIKSRIRKKRGS